MRLHFVFSLHVHIQLEWCVWCMWGEGGGVLIQFKRKEPPTPPKLLNVVQMDPSPVSTKWMRKTHWNTPHKAEALTTAAKWQMTDNSTAHKPASSSQAVCCRRGPASLLLISAVTVRPWLCCDNKMGRSIPAARRLLGICRTGGWGWAVVGWDGVVSPRLPWPWISPYCHHLWGRWGDIWFVCSLVLCVCLSVPGVKV